MTKKRKCELQVIPAICTRPSSPDPKVNSTSLLHLATQQTVDPFHPGTIYRGTSWVLREVVEVGAGEVAENRCISVWTEFGASLWYVSTMNIGRSRGMREQSGQVAQQGSLQVTSHVNWRLYVAHRHKYWLRYEPLDQHTTKFLALAFSILSNCYVDICILLFKRVLWIKK